LIVQNKRNERPPGRLLSRAFFEDSPEHVAPRLLGKILVRKGKGREPLAGRIVEVEAYLGPHHETPDAAAHSHRGPTPRNSVLFGPAGFAYVYQIYGQYFCMNISCEPEGQGGGILLRALEPLTGLAQMARNRGVAAGAPQHLLTSGPGRLSQALGITRAADNGLDLLDSDSPLQVRDDGFRVRAMVVTARIGINPANPALDWPLRFAVEGHVCVSGPKSFTGKRVLLR
jgi:DNA-3-methyladenine glycosylase